MKTFTGLTLAVMLLLLRPAPAQTTAQEQVRAVIQHEIDGWAKFDAKMVASNFTDDAIWQNPFGVRLHGSAQLERFLTNLFARPGYRSATDTEAPKILDIRMQSPDVAVVWSDESSKGQIDDATGKPMAPRHSYYLEVLVRKNGTWKISESMIMDIVAPGR
jgi:uncharacterized protein (TIGR02246 family)